ncbi:MAG: hypothetical protein GYA57_02180 [Myxococcales bacterium]|nr:hypothetical protein [Myxococcales bacterium]
MRRLAPLLLLAAGTVACGEDGYWVPVYPDADAVSGTDAGAEADNAAGADADADAGTDADPDAVPDAGPDADADAADIPDVPATCGFGYETMFTYAWHDPGAGTGAADPPEADSPLVARIAHAEPLPPFVWNLAVSDGAKEAPKDIVMPGYDDTMPLFERAEDWGGGTRCYETPAGVRFLTEPEAFDLYVRIASETTGVAFNGSPGRRTALGLRGAYPGTFAWHGNRPDRFNDTLVLLWIEPGGRKRVLEFPVNTDTGAHDFGADSSSSLRPNRRYRYVNGWHRTYNAWHIDEDGYRVRDDHNTNGHWDSDRNGWLPPPGADHDRTGGGHNIHMGSVDAPLGSAAVGVWSAGCQVIPGMANWTQFIRNAWTAEGDRVDYFLVDVRDIPPEVWTGPCVPDGSHACPFRIESFPFTHSGDTSAVATDAFDVYNCSTADESGPEVVYVFTIDRSGTLSVSVDAVDPVDPDVHLLDGDEATACLARAHIAFDYAITPGRYFLVVDTFVDAAGTVLAGPYTLHVDLR